MWIHVLNFLHEIIKNSKEFYLETYVEGVFVLINIPKSELIIDELNEFKKQTTIYEIDTFWAEQEGKEGYDSCKINQKTKAYRSWNVELQH